MEPNRHYEITNIKLDENFKQLIYRESVIAQNERGPFYLSKLISYEIYHDELNKYFKMYYKKKPTQTDNLSFIMLLTYPKSFIERITSFNDIKLAFNCNDLESDFEYFGFDINEDDDGMSNSSTCICNEPLKNIHTFRNKHSGISIQLGCVCNEKYGLISKHDPNFVSSRQKINEFNERKREQLEGKLEGFYKREREEKKIEQKEKKVKQEEEKVEKNKIKIEEQVKRKNIKDPNAWASDYCIYCNNYCIYNKDNNTICICSKCVPEDHRNKKELIMRQIKRTVKLDDCSYCEAIFISTNKNELCVECVKTIQIKYCLCCKEKMCLGIDQYDKYCNDCEQNIKPCGECKTPFIVPSEEKWKTYCKTCYPNISANKKENINGDFTEVECKNCYETFMVSKKETWKNTCVSCYILRSMFKCESCGCDFKRLQNEDWKKKCSNCYYKSR